MQEDKNHILFTAEDIRRYHEGKLTPGQMHALEKAALEDPFLADALEGYAVDEVRVPEDIDELKKRLQERTKDKKIIPISRAASPTRWLRVAAMIVTVAGAGLIVYNLGFNAGEKKQVAQQIQVRDTTEVQPEARNVQLDSTTTDLAHDKDAAASKVNGGSANLSKPSVTGQETSANSRVQADKEDRSGLINENKQGGTAKAIEPVAAPANEEVAKALNGRAPGLEVQREKKAQQEFLAAEDSVRAIARDNWAKQSNAKTDNSRGYANALPGQNANPAFRAKPEQALRPQPNIFRGRVTDDQNNPLPFANITNSRDNVGTYADAQGNFVLTSPDSVMNVQVRSLGFDNNNVQLQNGLTMNHVELKEDNSVTAIVLSDKKVNARMRQNSMVLEEPEPADGWTKYDDYLANNLKVPDDYQKTQKQGGQVELSFEVNQLGEPVNIRVEKSLCEICDKEAIRLLKEGPKWKRKAKKGKRTSIMIPF
ncbi:MAG: hypothetical protein DI535_13470 [Citrobacter freundii]|nr:MAG: hypothetical protein DI535_13470 [Citrobacter freundii]